jgi:hypothetical protein
MCTTCQVLFGDYIDNKEMMRPVPFVENTHVCWGRPKEGGHFKTLGVDGKKILQ